MKRIEIMEASLVEYFELDNDDDTEQETDSLPKDDTSTQTGEDDLSEVCESSSDAETPESTEEIERPPEEMSEDKETA